MANGVIASITGVVFGFWDIVLWLVRTWCELIVTALSLLGWLLVIGSMLLVFSYQLWPGVAAYALGMAFFVGRDIFKLLDFWLSDKRYTVTPEAFVGDIVGTAILFVLVFGLLLAIWYFIFPDDLLFVPTVALAPIYVLGSLSRFARNFLATMKDKLKPRPAEEKKGGPSALSTMASMAAAQAPKAVEAAKKAAVLKPK